MYICSFTHSKSELIILNLIKENPSYTGNEMSLKSNISKREIQCIIRTLRENDVITRIGSNRKGYWIIIK